MEGQRDGETLFYRTLLGTARIPKKTWKIHTVNLLRNINDMKFSFTGYLISLKYFMNL